MNGNTNGQNLRQERDREQEREREQYRAQHQETIENSFEELSRIDENTTYAPERWIDTRRLLEYSQRAQENLPQAQATLENALSNYRGKLQMRLRPASLGAIAHLAKLTLGAARDITLPELYQAQSRCFDYMLEIIDDLVAEADNQHRYLDGQRQELASWIDSAEPAFERVRETLKRHPPEAYSGLERGTARGTYLDQYRSSGELQARNRLRLAYDRGAIHLKSRKDQYPSLETYTRIVAGISETAQILQAQTLAAREFFERTLGPAQFIDEVSEILPYLDKGVKEMKDYGACLDGGLEYCTQGLKRLNASMRTSRRTRA